MLLLRFSGYYPGIGALIDHANQIVNGGTLETIRGPITTNGTKGNNAGVSVLRLQISSKPRV